MAGHFMRRMEPTCLGSQEASGAGELPSPSPSCAHLAGSLVPPDFRGFTFSRNHKDHNHVARVDKAGCCFTPVVRQMAKTRATSWIKRNHFVCRLPQHPLAASRVPAPKAMLLRRFL
eukprot:178340-Rhodomonas_salina.2